MKKVESDYADKVDGIYLYANDSVAEFYPKFGFCKSEEYQYTKNVDIKEVATICQIPMTGKEQFWDLLQQKQNLMDAVK